jgi:heat shock protein HtpX
LFHLGESAADAWRADPNGPGNLVALAVVPAWHSETHKFSLSGNTVIVELYLPTGQPGTALYCRFHSCAEGFLRLQRQLHRTTNHRRSTQVMAGMILLLALCGWIADGADGVRQAVNAATASPDAGTLSPEFVRQQFGARLLRPHDAPMLFEILKDISLRADLPRMPDIYAVAAPDSMNAYALGRPLRSAIVLTDGLLHGMTLREIAGILAHEVAHIRNNHTQAMSSAFAVHRAIAFTSLIALASLQAQSGRDAASRIPLALLLGSASAFGQLLYLGLSRICELDADATALELIDDPQAFVAALLKLERHHGAGHAMSGTKTNDSLMRLLHSHPATSERVNTLQMLAH